MRADAVKLLLREEEVGTVMMGITEIVLVVAGCFPCEEATDAWLLIAPVVVVVFGVVGTVGILDLVDWTSG